MKSSWHVNLKQTWNFEPIPLPIASACNSTRELVQFSNCLKRQVKWVFFYILNRNLSPSFCTIKQWIVVSTNVCNSLQSSAIHETSPQGEIFRGENNYFTLFHLCWKLQQEKSKHLAQNKVGLELNCSYTL